MRFLDCSLSRHGQPIFVNVVINIDRQPKSLEEEARWATKYGDIQDVGG
jgi:hypothetical protein